MGNLCGQQHPQLQPPSRSLDTCTTGSLVSRMVCYTDNGGSGEQTTVYIYVKLQPKQGNWDWNQMLQEISDVKYNYMYDITDI